MPAETVVWLEGRAGRRLPMRQEAGDLAKAELEKDRTARALGERQGGAEAPEAVGSDVGPGQTRKLAGGPPTCPGSDRLGTEKGLRTNPRQRPLGDRAPEAHRGSACLSQPWDLVPRKRCWRFRDRARKGQGAGRRAVRPRSNSALW